MSVQDTSAIKMCRVWNPPPTFVEYIPDHRLESIRREINQMTKIERNESVK
jgi:hypothetical protein